MVDTSTQIGPMENSGEGLEMFSILFAAYKNKGEVMLISIGIKLVIQSVSE
jgi:hypothetical protein